jgi:hypothetical protein
MTASNFSHLIEVDEGGRLLTIYRVRGVERELYTSVRLPETTWDENRHAVEEFCRKLGENIVFDSPSARKLLGI